MFATLPQLRRGRRPHRPADGRLTNWGCRGSPAGFHPHFLFGEPQKENGGGAVKRKNALPPGSRARSALPPGGMRVVTVLLSWGKPLRNHGRGANQASGHCAPCCTAQLSGKDRVDQLLFPRSPLRSALPGWSRPVAETTAPPLPCGELNPAGKGTDSHVASLLGMTENPCHCKEAAGRRGNLHPPSPAFSIFNPQFILHSPFPLTFPSRRRLL